MPSGDGNRHTGEGRTLDRGAAAQGVVGKKRGTRHNRPSTQCRARSKPNAQAKSGSALKDCLNTFAIVSLILLLPFAIWSGVGILPRYDITQATKSFGLLLCIVLPLFVSASWRYVFILWQKEGES